MRRSINLVAVPAALAIATAAHANVKISSAATSNMTCSGSICVPTATDANLNVGDLENYLAAGNVEVTTTGSGVQASDIVIEAGFDWAGASALALDAFHSVKFESPVAVNGTGAVSLLTNDGGSGGTLSFISGGSLSFRKPKNSLSINTKAYKLASSLPALAADIAAKPRGRFALSASYDARQHGKYSNSPIHPKFSGTFNGLGNTISNLSIYGKSKEGENLGLFAEIEAVGVVNSIHIKQGTIKGNANSYAGLVAGINFGTNFNSSVAGAVSAIAGKGVGSVIGGVVGDNQGVLNEMAAAVDVTMSGHSSLATAFVGGLAGDNVGTISLSYGTGAARASDGIGRASSGGLIGANDGPVDNSYATGPENIGASVAVGGLIGYNAYAVTSSYSTGAPTAQGGVVGGSMGNDQSGGISNVYWDTTSSGITNPSQGRATSPTIPASPARPPRNCRRAFRPASIRRSGRKIQASITACLI